MRNVVSIETVAAVRAIPEADAIEAITIRGWTVVAKKGEFAAGDPCVYIEIDAALPMDDARFAFLALRGTKVTVEGRTVHVLKTARLRGVYSQGLALPLDAFPDVSSAPPGIDLAALLRIEKWEPPVHASLGGDILGAFPTSLARKTDAERVQNLVDLYPVLRARAWVATEKIDGTSVTYIHHGGRVRVCGRNWELAEGPNVYWTMCAQLDLSSTLGPGQVIQGEIYGESIQGNPLKVRGQHLAVFGFFEGRVPVPRDGWPAWVEALGAPVLATTLPDTVEELIATVNGMRSAITPERLAEGVVFHTADGAMLPELDDRGCFKVVSNAFLLKHG
jgi:RNA ligase (TIGR02306 family)